MEGPAPNSDIFPQTSYHSKNINYIIPISLHFLFWHKIPITKCETCGRYFLADTKKTKYCNYISLDNPKKLCNAISKELVYKATIEKSPLQKEYRKVYQRLEGLSSKKPNIPSHKETFDKFKIEGKSKKHDWKNGKISDEEFKKWLDSIP